MSKITQALEKAARERLQRLQETATTKVVAPVEMSIEPASRISSLTSTEAEHIRVDPHIVAATDPQSPIAEQYRILRTNLQSLKLRAGSKVIVVTSAVHGEGKSVTSVNLALTLARQENLRVVLIDADLRKPSVHRWLGMPVHDRGLATALQDGGNLDGCLLKMKEPGLTLLPAGGHPEHPAELLESTNMRKILATLRAQFDVIIIDAPPVLPVADPGILAAQADGVLLVVRAGRTQRKTASQAQALLTQMKANILGCVLTHVEYYLPGYYRYYHQYRYGVSKDKKDKDARDAAKAAAPKSEKPVTATGESAPTAKKK